MPNVMNIKIRPKSFKLSLLQSRQHLESATPVSVSVWLGTRTKRRGPGGFFKIQRAAQRFEGWASAGSLLKRPSNPSGPPPPHTTCPPAQCHPPPRQVAPSLALHASPVTRAPYTIRKKALLAPDGLKSCQRILTTY